MTARQNIAFIDTAVANYQTLVAGMAADTEIVLINGGDGLQQMASVLEGRHGIDSVYVVSHGSAGALQLGDHRLDAASLAAQANALARIGGALSADADLLLYGCDVGAGEAGENFVNELALRTGADVAASSDPTGNAALGGNWTLEIHQGSIETALPFSEWAIKDFSTLLALPTGTIQPESFNSNGTSNRTSADGYFVMTAPVRIDNYSAVVYT